MVSVVVFEFSGVRCQPLRRALCAFSKNGYLSLGSMSKYKCK
ncbi:TPA: acetyltransferase [Vibrio cholerae]|nr:acetyltransferase [Vibrio cholerae]